MRDAKPQKSATVDEFAVALDIEFVLKHVDRPSYEVIREIAASLLDKYTITVKPTQLQSAALMLAASLSKSRAT
jgi:hypothetical protein